MKKRNDKKKSRLNVANYSLFNIAILGLFISWIPTLLLLRCSPIIIHHIYLVISVYTIVILGFSFILYSRYIEKKDNKLKSFVNIEREINGRMILINNEEKLKDVLSIEIERLKMSAGESCIVFFDIDNLGKINENYGFDIGDQVLIDIIQLTKEMINENELLARIKGDTFAVVLPKQSEAMGAEFANYHKNKVSQNHFLEHDIITCRYAVVTISASSKDEKIISIAMDKLQLAKEFGNSAII